jgi:hypothetical protein
MLLEPLNSLKESRIQLQRQLAQRPEYRALLIIDRAALQLAENFEPPSAPDFADPESAGAQDSDLTTIAVETTEAVAEIEGGKLRIQDVEVKTTASMDEPSTSLSPFAHLEDPVEKAPAPADEPIKAAARAIDLFLSSTAQAAVPIASASPPRRYLPFVAAPRPFKSAAAN